MTTEAIERAGRQSRVYITGIVAQAMTALVLGAVLLEASGHGRWSPGHGRARGAEAVAAAGSECLIGGSDVASGCVVTTQQPVLQIPGTGRGNVYIVDGSSPDQNDAWVSDSVTLDPSSACGGNTCYTVPPEAGLLPRHSYQWTFFSSAQAARHARYLRQLEVSDRIAERLDPSSRVYTRLERRREGVRDSIAAAAPAWQGFTIDYVRAGREPTDSFGR